MDPTPPDLRKVLAADPTAQAAWDDLTSIARRDFTTWIESAIKPETRARRVESVPSRLASGKRRICCFAVVPLDFSSALNDHPDAKARWKGLSADHKRDFTDWVGAAKGKDVRAARIGRAMTAIAAGKTKP